MAMQSAPASMNSPCSFLSPLGYEYSSCGYCKSKPNTTSASYWMRSIGGIHPSHYQILVDRGWRRSGRQYYKPDVRHSCCPHYTIRLDAAEYQPTKDQRKVINRFGKYILGSEYAYKAAMLCPKTRLEKKRRKNIFDLGEAVRCIEFEKIKKPVDPSTKIPINPAHKLEITLEPDKYTEEKYALFAHYQKTVHREPPSRISRSGFRSFLCSGLGQSTIESNNRNIKTGSYHQCYRLDGQLVAIGVLDLLPHAVSSVYLIYHQSVESWNFGKISAMQEINFALEEGYNYYYMGYYIHSCPKMRYKATYRPTYVLDPESYSYTHLDRSLLSRLDQHPYVSVSRDLRLGLNSSSSLTPSTLQLNDTCTSQFVQELEMGSQNCTSDSDYTDGQSRKRELIPPKSTSLFEKDMPGAMSLEEVCRMKEFECWRMKIGDVMFELEDLSDWETSEMTDVTTVKGIAAELAAVVGPDIVGESVIEWGSS